MHNYVRCVSKIHSSILNISILLYKFNHYELNIEIIIQQIPSILHSFMRYGVR